MLSSLLSEPLIRINVSAKSAEEVITDLSTQLEILGKTDSGSLISEKIIARENALSTGVGNGIAIPHTLSTDQKELVLAFAQLEEGVDFRSIDGIPVDLIFLFIAPQDETSAHLQLLSRISRLCIQEDFNSELRNAKNATDVMNTIQQFESILNGA